MESNDKKAIFIMSELEIVEKSQCVDSECECTDCNCPDGDCCTDY